MKTFTLARLKRYSSATAVYAVLLSSLVFVAACDQPSQKQRFADQISRVGIPPDATNVVILDEYWYTFEWKDQCFLGTKFYRNSALTKIDCEK